MIRISNALWQSTWKTILMLTNNKDTTPRKMPLEKPTCYSAVWWKFWMLAQVYICVFMYSYINIPIHLCSLTNDFFFTSNSRWKDVQCAGEAALYSEVSSSSSGRCWRICKAILLLTKEHNLQCEVWRTRFVWASEEKKSLYSTESSVILGSMTIKCVQNKENESLHYRSKVWGQYNYLFYFILFFERN